MVKPDLMHVFNIGIGGDMAASCLIALCHMKLFGHHSVRSLPKRMDEAYLCFDAWCSKHGHCPRIKDFELKTFKVQSLLDLDYWPFICNFPTLCGINCLLPAHPRLASSFPKGTGRAHDTALLCKWLQSELDLLGPQDVVLEQNWYFWVAWGPKSFLEECPFSDFYGFLSYQDPVHQDYLQVLQWTFRHTNQFFSMIHKEGIWISAATARIIVQHAYDSAEPWYV